MKVSQQYDIIDLEKGILDRRIFSDPAIYEEELEKVFGRAWLFIGHESLIPSPNDFFLTYMGEDPVILTRDAKGEVHAFLNMCRHRGNRIVRADDGSAKNFMCAYHGWTYSNEGKLVSVPGLQEAYYGELDVENLGLVSVAHLDTYAGLVFATWAEDAPTLEAYLGDMRWFLDSRINHRDTGLQHIGPVKWVAPFNWKTPVENACGDNYHAILSHRSATIVQAARRGRRVEPMDYAGLRRPGSRQTSPGNGHGLLSVVLPEETNAANEGRSVNASALREKSQEDHAKAILPEVEKRLGVHRARRVSPSNYAVWPNFWSPGGGLHLALPRGSRKTEVWTFAFYDIDSPEEIKQLMRYQSVHGAGQPGGLSMQDDMDNWRGVTDSGRLIPGLPVGHNLSMGLGHQGSAGDRPGIQVSHAFCSEVNQRTYYTRWEEFMNAESWADIHIDPITAVYEGTASLRG
jgi:phenylpropionate dioxygenase-like ring-hydroxylating dioxygenase large terminal subunit